MASYDVALVDEIRKRLECTYEEAVLGLDAAEGDLVRALAATERIKSQREGAQISGELVGKAIELAKEGRLKGLRVKLGDRAIGEVPLPKGAAGGVVGAVLTLLLARVSVELVTQDAEEPPAPEAEVSTEAGTVT
jgi:hypothetical protein